MGQFISVCMIVKNEEKVLDRCLASVAHLVDEVIIVDTGSTDATREIASKYTNNIFHFRWINDFSAARNYAASKASGEWILVLDADEYIDEENFNHFLKELKESEKTVDAYTAKILNFTGSFGENLIQNFHDRVYKNSRGISYYRKIHEQFKRKDNKPLQIKNSSLLIFHSGYLNQTVKEKEKSQRNKELLNQEITGNVNKAFDHFNFGNEYFSIGEYSKALDSYLEAYKLKKDFRLSWVSTTLIQIIFCLMQLKRYNDALNVIEDAKAIYSTSPEFPFLKGEVFLMRGQIEEAQKIFQYIINKREEYSHIIFRPDLKDQVPHKRLGEIYFNKKDYKNAILHYVNVLNLNKYCEESIQRMVIILSLFHTPQEIAQFLITKNLVNNKNLKFYSRVCFEIGNPKLALLLIDNQHEGHELLYKIAKVKIFCIHNEGEIEDISNILDQKTICDLTATNWVNIIDLYLLKRKEELSDKLGFLEQNNDFNRLVGLLEGTKEVENREEVFLYSLKILLQYKHYSICNVLFKNVDSSLSQESILKAAGIFFEHGFKSEALYLYDKAHVSSYAQQDFVNVIESLIETGNKVSAVKYAHYATETFTEDYKFYQYILNYTEDQNLYKTVFKKTKAIFQRA